MPNRYEQLTWSEQLEDDCLQLVRLAVREDLDREQDWTTVSMVNSGQQARAAVVSRQRGVFCGTHVVDVLSDAMQLDAEIEFHVQDEQAMSAGQRLIQLSGNARDILTVERTLLNFLGRLCGIASLTAQYVEQVSGTGVEIYDTRKTTPGWRRLEKYAVHCGGGTNHRTGLFDAILIKDNHLAFADLAATPERAIERVREFLTQPGTPVATDRLPITIEVDSLDQFQQVLPAKPDIVLLDNMNPAQLKLACQIRAEQSADVILEASGGITMDTLREVAETGIDRISIGALTHSAISLDLGLDWG